MPADHHTRENPTVSRANTYVTNMTIREHMASQLGAGLLSGPAITTFENTAKKMGISSTKVVARAAVELTDALLSELDGTWRSS